MEKFQLSIQNLNNLWNLSKFMPFCSKSMWRKICAEKICVEKKWQIWGLVTLKLILWVPLKAFPGEVPKTPNFPNQRMEYKIESSCPRWAWKPTVENQNIHKHLLLLADLKMTVEKKLSRGPRDLVHNSNQSQDQDNRHQHNDFKQLNHSSRTPLDQGICTECKSEHLNAIFFKAILACTPCHHQRPKTVECTQQIIHNALEVFLSNIG